MLIQVEARITQIKKPYTGGRVGTLEGLNLDEISRLLGFNPISQEDKVRVSWRGKILGKVFEIYDYKNNAPLSRNTYWSVGGDREAIEPLNAFLKASLPGQEDFSLISY